MDHSSKRDFLDIEEAAELLKCSDKDILQLVREKKIPHSVLPFGKVLFDRDRLKNWVLSFEQTTGYTSQTTSVEKRRKISIKEEIIQRYGCTTKERNKYTNLYLEQQIYAQLHPRNDGDGINLALRERGDDDNLPKCSILNRIELEQLNGYWKTNRSWLDGNGRFTDHPAAAFHIPGSLQDNPENPGWNELKILLEYTEKKYSKK